MCVCHYRRVEVVGCQQQYVHDAAIAVDTDRGTLLLQPSDGVEFALWAAGLCAALNAVAGRRQAVVGDMPKNDLITMAEA